MCIQTDNRKRVRQLLIFMTWFSCIVSQSTCNSLSFILFIVQIFFELYYGYSMFTQILFTFHWTLGATVWARVTALPLLLSEGTVALTMVSPLPRGDTSEWFVVGEDWWTAIATLFLCKINSTCRSALYEWWRPPQAIHTAAQRHGCGPQCTYKAGIKQSLFSTGPCITHPHPHMNLPTWIHR